MKIIELQASNVKRLKAVDITPDGSLLDSDAMEALRAQVAENDFQLWLEKVGDADEGAVIIEDGEVRA